MACHLVHLQHKVALSLLSMYVADAYDGFAQLVARSQKRGGTIDV